MRTSLIHILILLSLLLHTACGRNSDWTAALNHAEAVMNEHPDSALNCLKAIPTSALTAADERARHALLYSQALDKNYIDLTNDSIIRIAVDYYRDSDNARYKFLSFYYQGRIYANAQELTRAALAYIEAEQLIDEVGDDYLAGLLYMQMGRVYLYCYDYPKSLNAYQLAEEHYTKADKPSHRLDAILAQALLYRNMNKLEDSYQTYHKILPEAKKYATKQRRCLGSLILLCIEMKKWDEAISIYNEFNKKFKYATMTSSFWSNIALLYAHQNDIENSRHYMKLAWEKAEDRQDSIDLYHQSSLIHRLNKSDHLAYEELETAVALQNSIIIQTLQQPVLTTQRDYLQQELEFQTYKSRVENAVRTIFVIMLLFVIVLSAYLLQKRAKNNYSKKLYEQDEKNKQEREKIWEEAIAREQSIRNLMENLKLEMEQKESFSLKSMNELKDELNNYEHDIERLRTYQKDLQKEKEHLVSLLQQNFKAQVKSMEALVNTIYKEYKDEAQKQKSIIQWAQERTSEFCSSPKAKVQLEKLVNEYQDNAMERLRSGVTLPNEAYYIQACYHFAGFSVNVVAVLLNETPNVIYKRRNKMRTLISESSSLYREQLLQLMQ